MAFNWDLVINALILITLGLVFAARITKQTISELLGGIRDFINGTREEAIERGEELLYYEWRYDRKGSTRYAKTNKWR